MGKVGHAIFALAGCMMLVIGIQGASVAAPPGEKPQTVLSDTGVSGFTYPESVAFEPKEKVLYVSQFGSILNPTLKDGLGKISKVTLTGKILEEHYLPASGEVLNKPKGLWIQGGKLWVTDIDVVWIFDLTVRKGRSVALPGAKFANDPTVIENVLYVSDSITKRIYTVTPADFWNPDIEPAASVFGTQLSFAPNGLFPSKSGALLVAGFDSSGQDYGVYRIENAISFETVVRNVGKLDGLAELDDGSLLVTDWKTGSLMRWHRTRGLQTLASGFRGPADFCTVPEDSDILVVVPDLVDSTLRFIRIAK